MHITTKGYVEIIQKVLARATPRTDRPREKGYETWDKIVTQRYPEGITRARGYYYVRERTARLFAERCTRIDCKMENPLGIPRRESNRAMLWAYLQRIAHRTRQEINEIRAITAHLILTQ